MDKLVEASFEDDIDRALVKQRYRGAQISLCANSDEHRVEIVPSCGFLLGDVTGLSLFNDVYSEQIAKWERHCEKMDENAEYLHAKCFFTSDIDDAVTNTPQEVITKMEGTSRMLKKFAADVGIGHVVAHVTLLTYNCSNLAERQARCRAAQAGWTVGGTFLECRVFTASQTYYFPQHGLVCNWFPHHLDLQIRRLRWWQSVLMDREGNEALLDIFFGRLGVEVDGPLLDSGTLSPNAHPWALQLKVDLQSLKDIELAREFIQAWQGNMRKQVMDEECRTLFCDIDLGELRMRALFDAKRSFWQSAHLRDHTERDRLFFQMFLHPRDRHPMSILFEPHGESAWLLRPRAESGDHKRMPMVSFNFLHTTGRSAPRVFVISARFLPRRRKPCANRNQTATVAC